MKEMTRGVVRSLVVGRFVGWVAINTEGASGGILIFWDLRIL